MIFSLFKRRERSPIPQQLYGGLVAQARDPLFFTDYGFPDTVTGRFNCLAMHMFLFSHRMKKETDPTAGELGQEVFDLFVDNIDQALREIGIGDQSVPKRKKRLVHTFYGQIDDFGKALENGDRAALADAVKIRFFAENPELADAMSGEDMKLNSQRICEYMFEAEKTLAGCPLFGIFDGQVKWPAPQAQQ